MKRHNEIMFELKGDGKQPIFLDLAASIIREIERGRLKTGDTLPGTRALAQNLGVHRNTVDAAYQELIMQGWLVAEPSKGTFVSHDLPDIKSRGRKAQARKIIPPAEPDKAVPSLLRVLDGLPDVNLMPAAEIARAVRYALITPALMPNCGYSDPRGALSLRTALADHLTAERGLIVSPDNVLVTRGSQMGLFLTAASIIEPGDVIAVEEPGYPLAWKSFRATGAKVIGVPVDAHGIDVEKLEKLAISLPNLKAVYVTPHHQYPTTATLGAGRRLKLLDIARRHKLILIEDDYDHEYRFEGRPVLPLAARAERDLPVIYIGSLSKILSPTIRVGYVVARPDILMRMVDKREAIDLQGDLVLEQAMADLMEDGVLRRHTRKARRVYESRRDFLANELQRKLGDDVIFDIPAGGLALWVRLREGLSAETWSINAGRVGLGITPGLHYALNAARAPEAFRIGYASLDEKKLVQVVDLLARTRPKRR